MTTLTTPLPAEAPEMGEARRCRRCETIVASCLPGMRLNLKYTETVLCPSCGADCSLRPPLAWRMDYGRAWAKRKRRLFGSFWWSPVKPGFASTGISPLPFHLGPSFAPWRVFLMPYEQPQEKESR